MFSSLIAPSLVPKPQFEQTAGQAFNDPLSNIVYLGPTISPSRALQCFHEGTYPPECLGPFLHEGTHHRCFDTPMGYSLLGIESFSRISWSNTLKCRSQKGSPSQCSSNPTCFNRALTRAIYQLLTPLAEGLALFGELDATPGTSTAASALLFNALSVFFYSKLRAAYTEANANLETLVCEYQKWLAAERSRHCGTFAKTRMLLRNEPSSPAVEPYRTGYKWISRLVETLHRASPEARDDLDVTLAFFCSYFFDDWDFAAMVAAASWNLLSGEPQHTLANIGDYLQVRTKLLQQGDIASLFRTYSTALTAGNIKTCRFLNFTNKREQQLRSFNAQAGAVEINWQAPKISRSRHIFRVATMPADSVTLDLQKGTFECSIDGKIFKGKALRSGFPAYAETNTATAHDQETAVELVLVAFQLLACIFYKGSLVAVLDRDFQPMTGEDIEKLLGSLSPFANAEYWRQHYWELLDPDPNSTCGEYLQTRLLEAKHLAHRIYS